MIRSSKGGMRLLHAISALLTISAVQPVTADILIMSSDAPALKPGMQLADSAKLEVPAGAKVRVMLPTGATLQINGPASRQVKDITKGEPLVESVWAKAKELVTTGGVDQSRPGATRGAPGSATSSAAGSGEFSWTVIPAAANGTVCVERGAKLAIARPLQAKVTEVTIIDTAANARARIAWAEGAGTAGWPDALAPKAETVYQLVATAAPVRQLKLQLIDKALTGEDKALRALLDNGCQAQARAYLQLR